MNINKEVRNLFVSEKFYLKIGKRKKAKYEKNNEFYCKKIITKIAINIKIFIMYNVYFNNKIITPFKRHNAEILHCLPKCRNSTVSPN